MPREGNGQWIAKRMRRDAIGSRLVATGTNRVGDWPSAVTGSPAVRLLVTGGEAEAELTGRRPARGRGDAATGRGSCRGGRGVN